MHESVAPSSHLQEHAGLSSVSFSFSYSDTNIQVRTKYTINTGDIHFMIMVSNSSMNT